MLQTIDEQRISWRCLGDEEMPCAAICSASVDDVEYLAEWALTVVDAETGQAIQESPDGAVIALPSCTCGAKTFLKADYKMSDFKRKTSFFEYSDEQGVMQFRTLKHGHARNIILHHLLYERGKVPAPPILPMVPEEEREQLVMELGLTASLWFTFHLLTNSVDTRLFERYFVETVMASKRVSFAKQQAISSPT